MLTSNGWSALFVAAAAFAIGRVFGIIELFVIGVGVLVVVGLSLLSVMRRPPRLAARRALHPLSVTAGESARVDLQVANLGQARTSLIQLWEPVGESGGATMHLAPLHGDEVASAAYRLPGAERGVVQIGPLRARRRDVLGLCNRTFVIPGSSELLVVPRHTPAGFSTRLGSGRLGDHLRMKAHGQTGSEFHSLREYVAGDDLRRISWKASARSNDLIVKETALEGVRRCTVVFDRDRASYDDESFERAVSASAALVTGAVAALLSTRLISVGADLRGPDVASAALRWLASVQPSDGGALPVLKSGEGLGIVVVVAASAASPTVAATRGSIGPDDTLVIVACRTMSAAPAGTSFVVDATRDGSFDEEWAALTGARVPTAAQQPIDPRLEVVA